METKLPLEELMYRYSRHPEFLGIDLSNVNQSGALDDTLLHIVARAGTVQEITLLIESEAQVNAVGDIGYTPLHYAAMKGRLDVIKRLLEFGANPKIQNEFGETSADVAENGGHTEVAGFLRSYLVNKDSLDGRQ